MSSDYKFHSIRYDFYGGDVNTYALETDTTVYLIDTAVNAAKETIEAVLRQAGVGEKELVILNTHSHWDHASLNGYFKEKYGAVIYAHRDGAALCEKEAQFTAVYGEFQSKHPERESIHDLMCQEFAYPVLPDCELHDGDEFVCGDMLLRVIETPGHSSDSVSFFEESRRLLFAGDAVQGRGFDGNAPFYRDAKAYLYSVQKLSALHPAAIYCGHGLVEGEAACEAFLRASLEAYEELDAAVCEHRNDRTAKPLEDLAAAIGTTLGYPDTVHIYTTVKAHTLSDPAYT